MPTSRTIKRYKYIGVMRQVNIRNYKSIYMPTSRTIKRYNYIGVMRQVNMEIIKVFICPPLNKSIYIHRSNEISE